MLQEDRFSKIIEYLQIHHMARINGLAEIIQVSPDTIRRDLATLEAYGVLERVRGGAVLHRESLEQHIHEMRVTAHSEEKSQIAPLIESVLEDGRTVAIGCGSTTLEIAKFIARKYNRLTIITNDMDIVKVFAHKEQFHIIVLGGLLDTEENATYGEYGENQLRQYNADVGLISVNSVSVEKGISDYRLNQLDILRQIIAISEKVVVAADSSKIQRVSCMRLCGTEEVDVLLSDEKMTGSQIRAYEGKGVQVITPATPVKTDDDKPQPAGI